MEIAKVHYIPLHTLSAPLSYLAAFLPSICCFQIERHYTVKKTSVSRNVQNYLMQLWNFHQKRVKQMKFTRKHFFPGRVALLMNDNLQREEWPFGLVLELLKYADGNVRSVKLGTQQSTLERTVSMLIPSEISEINDEANVQRTTENTNIPVELEESETKKELE